jgi:RHS repeat-associated protein
VSSATSVRVDQSPAPTVPGIAPASRTYTISANPAQSATAAGTQEVSTARPSNGALPVLTIHYDVAVVTPPQIYAIGADGSAAPLASEVDAAAGLVSATIQQPGSYFAGSPTRASSEPPLGPLTGTVTLPDGTTPLPGAVVRASSDGGPTVRAVTGADGGFSLPIGGGQWIVSVDPMSNYVMGASRGVDRAASNAPLNFVARGPPQAGSSDMTDVGAPELPGLRTQTTRTFRLPDGRFETVVYAKPVSYRGPDGSWQLIDTSLSPVGDSGTVRGNAAGPFKVRFNDQLAAGDGTIGTVLLPNGGGFTFGLPGAGRSSANSEAANALAYMHVQPGVALHYSVTASGVKESIELADAQAPSSYVFRITPLAGSQFVAQRRADGAWIFTAPGAGRPSFVLEPPIVGDASTLMPIAGELVPIATGTQAPAELDVHSLGDGSFLAKVTIDAQWLRDPARLFPVLIDPTVTISPDSRDAVFNLACGSCTPSVGTTMNVADGLAGAGYQASVLQFDLGGITPTGITGGTLSLYWSNCAPLTCGTASGNGQQGDIGLYQMATAWNLSTTTAEIAYLSTQLSHVTLNVWSGGDQPNKWVNWDVPASALTNWLNGVVTNNGFLLVPVGPTSQFNFLAAASGDATHSPQLKITWSGDASVVHQPQIVHSNGAELEWEPFPASTGAQFKRYDVYRWISSPSVAPSWNEITDTTRAKSTEGDGRSSDSSFGLWEATTNLSSNGGMETSTSGWFDSGSGSTLTQSATGAKFGAKALQVTNASGTPTAAAVTSIAVSPGAAYTVSSWVSGSGTAFISFNERTSADTSVADYSSATVMLTSAPQRIGVTRTPASGNTLARIVITGSAGATLYIDGVQLEQKAFATPYVETSGAAASRTAGRVQEAASGVVNPTQGWVATRVRLGLPSSVSTGTYGFFEWGDATTNRFALSYNATAQAFEFTKQVPGYTGTAGLSASFAASDLLTLIAAWDTTGIRISVNGSSFQRVAETHVPVLAATMFDIGRLSLGGASLADSDILWFAAGTGNVGDGDAGAFNAIGSSDPTLAAFTAHSEATFTWWGDGVQTNVLAPGYYTPIATIADPALTRYVDTTAGPNRNFTYQIVTVTDSATSPYNNSNMIAVQTPADGQAVAVLQPHIASALAVTLDSTNPNTNFGSYTVIVAQGSSARMRSLVKFDLRQISASATVTSATLSLYTAASNGTPGTIAVHRASADWRESEATWSQRLSGVSWTTAGGDFDPTVASSIGGPGPIGSWDNFDVAGLVQNWINNSANNYGFLLKLANEANAGYDQWNSDDLLNGHSLTPKLTVYYNDGSHALPPAVSLGAPGPNATVNGASVELSASASDDTYVTRVDWSIDGGTPLVDQNAPYLATLNSLLLSRGVHELTVTAVDIAGNWSRSTVSLNVANSSPPSYGGSTVTGSSGVYTITVTEIDDRVINRVDYFANGDYIGSASTRPLPGSPTMIWAADTTSVQTPNGPGSSIQPSGHEISDASRSAGVQGDGRLSPDSSFGVWDATTNLITNGGFETNASGWDNRGTGSALAQTTVGTKFGANALHVTNGTGTPVASLSASIAVTPGLPYTASAWVSGSGTAFISFNERSATDTSVADYSSTAVTLTSTPQRINITRTPSTGNSLARVVITGSAASTLYVDGAQLEQQALATPYVETNGSSASRGAAAPTVSAAPLSPVQGWVAMRLRMGWSSSNFPSAQPGLFGWGSDPANSIALYFGQSEGKILFGRSEDSASAVGFTMPSFNAGDYLTVIAAWDSSRLWLSTNGAVFSVNTSTNTNTVPKGLPATFAIGAISWAGFGAADADVLWFAAGTGKLSNADAKLIARMGTTDPSFGSNSYTARWNTRKPLPGSPVLVWSADDSRAQLPSGPVQLNVTGNEMTDVTRVAAVGDDGRAAADSSFGIWDATTNLVTNGGFETNTNGWSTVGGTISRITTYRKFGNAAMQITVPGVVVEEGAQGASIAVSSNTTYTVSGWMRGSGASVGLAVNEYAAGSLVQTKRSSTLTVSAAWQRLTYTFTTSSTTTTVTLLPVTFGTAQAATFYIDGVQLEQKPTATPYVDTNGAAETRGEAWAGAPSFLLSPVQGWVALRVRLGWAKTSLPNVNPGLFGWIGTGTYNRIGLYFNSAGNLQFERDQGTFAAGAWTTPNWNAGDIMTVVATWDATQLRVSINGSTFSSVSNTNTAPAGLSSTFWIGTWLSGRASNSDIVWFAAGTGTLSNNDPANAFLNIGTSDPSLTDVYDGTYSITAKAYDDDGQVTTSTLSNVTVAYTPATRYQVDYSSTAIPAEMTYDPALGGAQTAWPIDVMLTNRATSALLAAQTVVRYRWYSADHIPVVSTSADIPLPSDIAAGGTVTVRVNATPPTLPAGIYRGRYKLRVDLYDTLNGRYFADAGNAPLETTVTVHLATPLELGFERYQQYDGDELGGGLNQSVNLANGNSILSWTPFDEPGRGIDTVVTLTYNSLEAGSRSPLGNNFLLTISGITPFGAPLDVHPNNSDSLAGRSAPWVGFIDGDGSYHTFTGQTATDGTVYWSAPPGVHLYLRQYSTTDTTRWWALTKPDRTTFFYDQNGNATSVQDANGNQLTLTQTAVPAGEDAYGATTRVTQITDAGGRSFTISYYAKALTGFAPVRGKVQSISDHLGRTITFEYFNNGNLLRVTQTGGRNPDGSWLPSRSIVFNYRDPAQQTADWWLRPDPNPATLATPRVATVIDFRGNETSFNHFISGSPVRRLSSRIDRLGNRTSYAYNTTARTTTVTMPLSRVWTYGFDTQGRAISVTDPVNPQPTTVVWSADNTVARITEPTGRHVDYAYNQNGYLTDSWDELGNHTTLAYQHLGVDANDVAGKWESGRVIPHVSQLVATTDPAGNLLANDGFEIGTSGWSDGDMASSTLTRDTTTAAFGAASLKVSGVDASHYPTVRTTPSGLGPVISGANYTFSVWANAPSGTSMDVAAYRSDFATLLGQTTFVGTGSWQLIKFTFTPAANEQAYLYVRSTSAFNGGSFWIDTAGLTATTSAMGAPFSYTAQFDYDAAGNPLRISDPLGNVTARTYNPDGTLATETEADNGDGITRTTTYNSYDANGLPTQVIDAAGGITRVTYDAAGNLTSLQDPNHATYSGGITAHYQAQYFYDLFQRLVRTSEPKSTRFTPGVLIWTGIVYDANDNVVSVLNPHYGIGDSMSAPATTTVYDKVDQLTLVTGPDTAGGLNQVQTDYDAAGRVIKVTSPKGVATTNLTKDYATFTTYDLLDRIASTTEYIVDATDTPIGSQTRTVYYCYDLAGDLRSITGPRGAASFTSCPAVADPAAYIHTTAPDTTKIAYDAAHRQIQVTDALGQTTSQTYDASDNVLATTDENGQTSTSTYGPRGEVTKEVEPFDSATGRTLTTIYDYDALGNLRRLISPRAYDASADKVTFTDFVTTYSYDALERRVRTTLPSQGGMNVTYFHEAYDANGNLIWTSLPTTQSTATNVAASDKTTNEYWDTDDLYSILAPAAPKIRYDYTAEGWQSARIPETAIGSGVPDYGRMVLWTYFADGKLKEQTDQAGLRDTFGYDPNGNQTSTTEALGLGSGSAEPVTVTASYDGFDQLVKVRIPKQASGNFWATLFAYDQHGNATTLVQNQEETAGGSVVTAGRTQTYTYDYEDQPTSQIDDFGTSSNGADDERLTFTWTPTGLESSKTIAKSDGAGGWINEQIVSETYYANGLLRTLTTTDGGSPATTIAQHTLSYVTVAGIYMNGNRVTDAFQLRGPDPAAPCYASACTASWQYDAQDRLVEEVTGTGTTTQYTLDVYGNTTQELTNGVVSRTATYVGLQLQTDTASGATKRYLYDTSGNLACAVTSAWTGSTCPTLLVGIAPDPALITYNLFDTKNRLVATLTYASGILTDLAIYTLDALDRTLSEKEWHSGVTSRTDFTYIGLSTAIGQEQIFDGSGALTETKSYVYDALGRRATITHTPAGGATSRYSYTFDPHGSIELLLDQNRNVKAAYGYTAYGSSNVSLTKTATGFSPNLNAYKFQSQRFDTGSNTLDFGARRYSPSIQRFVQRDSFLGALDDLGLSSDPLNGNRYVLTGANPINFVDLDGHRGSFGGFMHKAWGATKTAAKAVKSAAVTVKNTRDRFIDWQERHPKVMLAASIIAAKGGGGRASAGARQSGHTTIYTLAKPGSTKVEYVGKTVAPKTRLKAHQRPGSGKEDLVPLSQHKVPASKARAAEQAMIERHGGAKSTNPGTPLRNKINAVSPKRSDYGQRVSEGKAALKKATQPAKKKKK